MAYIISSKFPLDTLPDVAIGVSVPFSAGAVFNQTYITRDQIKSNLINFFLTNPGERYLNPNFGGGVRALLFEAISQNTLDGFEADIVQKLKRLFPSVSVNSVNVISYPNDNIISITVDYQVLNQSSDQLQINFNTDGI
jgi:phage baseplate assembly protein W